MSISNKTRKILWAKSGNQCAICKKGLICEDIVVDQECHIVSEEMGGPRHREMKNYNTYDNFILLCSEHHKMVDEDIVKYTEKVVHQLKNKHEKEIQNITQDKANKLTHLILLPVKHTRDLVRYLKGAENFATDYPVECEENYDLFEEFIYMVNNSDVYDFNNEFNIVKLFDNIFNKIINAGYFILANVINDFGPHKLKTVFVYIVTKIEFENNKILV